MANGLQGVNISGSPAVVAKWKVAKKYILLLRSLVDYLSHIYNEKDEDCRSTGNFMNF